WIKHPEPRQRRAAVEVLVNLGAPDAPAAIATLLSSEATRDEAIKAALVAPSPDLAAPLAAVIPNVGDESKARAIAAMGRAGGAKAVSLLAGMIDSPDLGTAAAFALAMMPGDDARRSIEKAILDAKTPPSKRQALRAGIVR